MILLNNIFLPLDFDFSDLRYVAARELKSDVKDIKSAKLYKKSVDARKKSDIKLCCSLTVSLVKGEEKAVKNSKKASIFNKPSYEWKYGKEATLRKRPVIVGFGPAGMFAALYLARAGEKPIVFERGYDVDKRFNDIENYFATEKLNENSNVQFGEGGAGTFSDGKLNTGIKDKRIRAVLETFYDFGANEDVLTDAKPHIGTDVLKNVVKNIRNEIISLGGEICFGSKLENLYFSDGKLTEICVNGEKFFCEKLALCIGHSARDTFLMLKENGFALERKPFAVGVRIEHLQKDINKALYGDFCDNENLGAADYKLATHLKNGRGVFTFCMCPGGEVINASSESGHFAINGMSERKRDKENANSAVLVGVNPEDFESDDVLAGVYFQRDIEKKAFTVTGGKIPVTTVGEFVFGKKAQIKKVKPSIRYRTDFADFTKIFPQFVTDSLKDGIKEFDKKIKGFADFDAVLTAPESRSSSPIRILRDEKGESITHKGIYPCGEGAGYAGGIMSAAVDGLKTAENILS